jgi:tetratricopeptide (TPR) repeat protein
VIPEADACPARSRAGSGEVPPTLPSAWSKRSRGPSAPTRSAAERWPSLSCRDRAAGCRSSDDEPAESRPAHEVPSPLEPPANQSARPSLGRLAKIAELRSSPKSKNRQALQRVRQDAPAARRARARPPREDRLYAKAADLYVSKFANQAEAVKAYEAVLAIDPDNAQAVDYLRQMYEKRRDWEKLLGLQRREAERLPRPRAGAKFLEIAKLATERVKKPEVCIDLWQEVLGERRGNAEALGALAGSTSARRTSRSSPPSRAAGRGHVRRPGEDPGPHQARDDLRRAPEQRRGRRRRVARAARARPERPQARRTRSRRSTSRSGAGTTSRSSTPRAASGTSSSASSSSRRRRRPTLRGQDLAPLQDRAALGGQEAEARPRRQGLREGPRARPGQPAAAEALIPIYAAANNAQGARQRDRGEAASRAGSERRSSSSIARGRGPLRGQGQGPAEGVRSLPGGVRALPGDERTSEDVERAPRRSGAWDRSWRPTAARSPRPTEGDRDGAVMLRLRLGRVLVDDLKRIDEALDVYRAVYEAEGENAEAIAALERLYRQTSRFAELLGIYEKRAICRRRPRRRRRSTTRSPSSTRTRSKDVDKAIDTYVASARGRAGRRAALAALDVLYGDSVVGSRTSTCCAAASSSTSGEAELIDLKFRLGQTLEKHLADAAGALENYREILFLDAQHEGARVALEAMLERRPARGGRVDPRVDLRGARRLAQAHPGARDPQRRGAHVEKRVALKRKAPGSAPSERQRLRARLRRARVGAARRSLARRDTRRDRAHRGRVRGPATARRPLRRARQQPRRTRHSLRDYWLRIAGITTAWATSTAPREAYYKVLLLDPADAEALAALEQLFTRTQRWKDLIGVVERRIEQTTTPRTARRSTARWPQIYDERLGVPRTPCGLQEGPRARSDQRSGARALDDLFTRQKMWSELAENLEAQLALAATDDEQLALMLRLAALRESRDGPRRRRHRGVPAGARTRPDQRRRPRRSRAPRKDPKYELDDRRPARAPVPAHRRLAEAHRHCTRSRSGAARTPPGGSSCSTRSRSSTRTPRATSVRPSPRWRAPCGRTLPTRPRSSSSTGSRARRAASRTSRARVFEDLGGADRGSDARERALHDEREHHENDLGNIDTAIALYRKVLEIDPLSLAAAESLERLFRSAERYQELSIILQRKSEILEEPAGQERRAVPGGRHRRGRSQSTGGRDRRLQPCPRDRLGRSARDRRAHPTLPRPVALERSARSCTPRRRTSSPTSTRKRASTTRSAPSTSASSETSRAIDTYTKILELDPDDCRRCRASTSSTSKPATGRSCSRCSRTKAR